MCLNRARQRRRLRHLLEDWRNMFDHGLNAGGWVGARLLHGTLFSERSGPLLRLLEWWVLQSSCPAPARLALCGQACAARLVQPASLGGILGVMHAYSGVLYRSVSS